MKLWRYTIHVFALIGLVTVGLAAYSYLEGWRATRTLDPKLPQVMGDFARRAMDRGAASALVVKLPLSEGVSRGEAIKSMELRANTLNIKLVGRLSFHKEMEARTGEPARFLEIFQFCDAATAARLLAYNEDYAAFMPCSIVLYETAGGGHWLATMNLDLLIHGGRDLEPELKNSVLEVKEGLLDILSAGATGAL